MTTNKTQFKITLTTNPYQASRNSVFSGRQVVKYPSKWIVTLEQALTLKEAQNSLLRYLNIVLRNEIGRDFRNWGLAINNWPKDVDGWAESCDDGTRYFTHDGYTWMIEADDNDNN